MANNMMNNMANSATNTMMNNMTAKTGGAGRESGAEEGAVVAVGRNRMGAGSDELGEILIKSYIYALREMQSPPAQLLFFNAGVYLACEGSAALEDLRALAEKGVSIKCCGTCLNYYQLTDKLAVGSVTNMADIASVMARASRLVNL